MTGYRIERRRDALAEWRQLPDPLVAAEGEVIAEIELAALTANNVTYAVHGGPPLHYARFFPAADPAWSVVPLWGYGKIIESRNADVAVGARFYGYWPSASHVKLVPGPSKHGGFADQSAHRQGLAPVYNAYRAADAVTAQQAPLVATFQPLFGTAFVLDHVLGQAAPGTSIVMTSASSKTALGTAFNLGRRHGLKLIGLTSAGNLEFVRKTEYYTDILTYDEIERLDHGAPSVLVDFAGNGALKRRLHTHLKGLVASHIVGDTHWAAPGEADLPGPAPALFFAPSAWEARAAEVGPATFEAELAAALQAFLATVPDWLRIETYKGPQGHAEAFDALLNGKAPADRGAVWRP